MRKLALLLLLSVAAAAFFHSLAGAQSTPDAPAPPQRKLDRLLKRYERFRVDVPDAVRKIRRGEPLSFQTSEGNLEVELVPNDLRGKSYKAEETGADGARHTLARAREVRTFRGGVRGLDQAEARFNLKGGAFEGMIVTPNERFYFERLGELDESAAPDEFIFYRASDLQADGAAFCNLTLEDAVRHEAEGVVEQIQAAPAEAAAVALREADVATEADYEYVTALGGSAAANAEILSIMNLVDGIYESQLGLSLKVVYQHAWASKPAGYPYTALDGNAVLNEFTNYWGANFAAVNRDLAHLFTGRDTTINGDPGLAGIAWVSVVCRIPSLSYGVSERFTNLALKQQLTAHEMGHNFGAGHSPGIMNAFLDGSLAFGAFSQSEIGTFVSSFGACLSPIATLDAVTLSPNPAVGGAPVTGTVTLTAPAPASGAVVTLSENLAAAAVPASVTIPAGQTSKTFTITTSAVTATQTGAVTAAYHGLQKTAALSVVRGFSVGGTVFHGGVGLGGVRVTLTSATAGFTPRTATTSSTGAYLFTLVPAGRSYVVTPSSAVFNFSPAARSVPTLSANVTGQNFTTLSRKSYVLSGRLALGGEGLNGVTVQLKNSAGAVLRSAVTATSPSGTVGAYAFASVPAGFNYTVAPASGVYAFTPASRAYTNLSADQIAQDFAAGRRSYGISGRLLLGATGLNGQVVQLKDSTGAVIKTAVTATGYGVDGLYVFTGIPAGFNYTVTPAPSAVFAYTPAARSYTNLSAGQTAQNFAAARRLYTISGTVFRWGSEIDRIGGVTLTLVNSLTQAVVKTAVSADGTGDFTLTGVPAGVNYTLRPSKAGLTFAPTARSYLNFSASLVGQNFSGQ